MVIDKNNAKNYGLLVDKNEKSYVYAAKQLNKYLKKCCGFTLEEYRGQPQFISIGYNDGSKDFIDGADKTTLQKSGLRIAFQEGNVYIYGGSALGTVYGVFEFCERYLGVRFLTSTDELTPKSNELLIQETDVERNPCFLQRECLHFSFMVNPEFTLKRRYEGGNAPNYKEAGLIMNEWYTKISNSHNSFSYVSKDKYYNKYPEMFTTPKPGSKQIYKAEQGDGDFFTECCYSNGVTDDGKLDETLEVSTAKVVADSLYNYIKEDLNCKYFPYGRQDNEAATCYCKKCVAKRAKYGGDAGTMIMFFNVVIDTVELYTEDTYVLPTEEYFGYLRGGYTAEELKDIDAYAKGKGVELIPCIQTIAHYTTLLRLPQYEEIKDVDDILLVDEPKTYALLEKIFAFLADTFSSKKINIGMDEAFMLGLGKFLQKNGYQSRFDILLRHLNKVCALAKKYGFTPHMWSDMFFRVRNDGEYYGKEISVDEGIATLVPENVQLVYWDYYHEEVELYDAMFAAHKKFGKEIWFAGGAWSWNGFAPFNELTCRLTKPAMQSVRKNGIKNVMITLWGDNGKECSFYALLPALYSISQYAQGNFDEESIRKGFKNLFGIAYEDFTVLDSINATKANASGFNLDNPCKVLFYNDCFAGFFDKDYEMEGELPFARIAENIQNAGERVGEFAYIHKALAQLARVLSVKANLGLQTRKAYQEKDVKKLTLLLMKYQEAIKETEKFHKYFKELWFIENKGMGFEIQDVRIGGVIRRLQTCYERLTDYIENRVACIEELEQPLRSVVGRVRNNFYRHIISASEL